MKNTFKRLLSFAVALVMVLGLIPVTQLEAEAATTAQSTVYNMEYMTWNDTGRKDANGNAIWEMIISNKQVDVANINKNLEGTPDADGKLSAYCYACKKTRTWLPVYDTTVMPNINSSGEEDIHFYLAEDVETTTLNDSNEYFWWRGTNRRSCLHLNGHDLTMNTANGCGYIYVGGGTLNIMGNGNVTGNCNQPNRGSAVIVNGPNPTVSIVNLFGGTYKSSNGKPAISTSGPYARLNLYPGATTEGISQLGTTKMYGGQVNGNVTCKLGTFTMSGGAITYSTYAVVLEGTLYNEAYTSVTFNMTGGTINGVVNTTRTKETTVTYNYTEGGEQKTKENTVPKAENTGDLVFNMSGGTLNGRGTKASPAACSGTCFFITEGGKVNISGGTVNAGWAQVDDAGNYGWGGIGYFRAPTGNQDITQLQTELNVSGGTINCANDDSVYAARTGGFAYLYGAKSAGKTDATSHPGKGVKMTVSGGIINGGRVSTTGGAIHSIGSDLEITGGTITGGRAGTYGGNIYVTANSEVRISNAKIEKGRAGSSGGNFYVDSSSSSVSITNSTISDGQGGSAGNLGFAKAISPVTITDSTITGGKATTTGTSGYSGGGSILVAGGVKVEFNNTEVSGGQSVAGGNMMVQSGSTVNLNAGTEVFNGKATGTAAHTTGGNLQTSGGTININKGASVYDGTAANNKGTEVGALYGGKIVINGGTLGTFETKTNKTVYLFSSGSNGASKFTVNDGIAYGELETAADTSMFALDIRHGVFSTAAVTVIAGDKEVKQNSEGLYEVHNVGAAKNVVDPTCTEDGYTAYTCSYETCAPYKTDLTDAHTQTFKAEEPASCTATGTKAYYACSCGKNYEDEACTKEIADLSTWTIAQKAHSYTGENGACVNGCGKTTCENEGHAWGEEIEAKAATCTEKGNIAYYDCANCELYAVGEDKTITAWDQIEIAIDANAHKYGNWVEVDENTHKHVCAYNAEHVETADHVYENGACVCGKAEPETNEAQVGGQKFDTLQAALEAVKETGGEVKLLKETTVTEDISVGQNVKLDLNGQTLKVAEGKLFVAYTSESFITDSSDDNSGRLVADISQLRLLENNPQLPVKMADGIMFVEAASGNQKAGADKNYQCWIDSADAALINALKAGNASDMALEFQVAITWGNNVLKYTFKDATVAEYMQNWQTHAMFLKITGAEGIEDLKYQARIVFADDTKGEVVVWAGDVVNHK